MSKEALIIIDMLNDFVSEGAPLEVPAARAIIANIRREIALAHEQGYPVIFVCDAHAPHDIEFTRYNWPPHAVSGTTGADIIDQLKPFHSDLIVRKTTYSAFHNTELEDILRTSSVDTVRLAGCVTHVCILFTAYESAIKGYKVEVVEDAVAGLAKEDHDAAIRLMKNVLGVTMLR